MVDDEGRFASIDVGTTDFSSVLSDLAVLETIARKYRGNFRMPRLIFPTLSVTPGGRSSVSDAQGSVTASLYPVFARNYIFNETTWDRFIGGDLLMKSGSFTAAGDNALWTPTAGKKFRLLGFSLSIDAAIGVAGNDLVKLTDGAAGT